MYIREKKTKYTTVLQLVCGARDENGKVKQKILLSLGDLKIPDEIRKTVAHEVEYRMNGYQALVPLDYEVGKAVDAILVKLREEKKLSPISHHERAYAELPAVETINMDDIEHKNGRELGPLLPLLAAWNSLGVSEFLKENKFSPRQIRSAQISIFNRLLEPVSENELINWASSTALNELLGERIELGGEDRFYRISDKLLCLREQLEPYLRNREHELFNLNRTIVLYDLTNSYFEGGAIENPKARRSANSKEKRTDCPLLSVGLVLDGDGFILTHKVFPGNLNDSKALIEAVCELRNSCGEKQRPIVVLDGGIASEKNLAWLREHGYDYVVNGKRVTRKRFAADFLAINRFRRVGARDDITPVFIRRVESAADHVLLCRSEERKKKEDAIVSKTEEKLRTALEKLAKRIAKNDGKLYLAKGAETVNRNIGKICGRYIRAAKFYLIEFDPATRILSWRRKDDEYQADAELHGCYHLRCSRPDLSDDEIWHIYITLTQVESAFRLMKSELGLRPFYHYKEYRCDGHVWLTILAYHLLHWVEYILKLAGYDASWRRIRRILQTHCYTTLIIPTKDAWEYRICRPGRPDERQRFIYSKLGIETSRLPIKKQRFKKKM